MRNCRTSRPSPSPGLAGYEAGLWSAFVLPAKAPAAVVARINREVIAVVNAPETRAALDKQGVVVETSTPRGARCADPQRRRALGRDHPRGGDRRQMTCRESEGMSVDALADIHVEDIEYLRHPSGPLLARIYRPKEGRPRAALVSMHGGRWTRETRLTNAVIDEALARDGALVMALDIRMPPVAALSRLPCRHQLCDPLAQGLCAHAGRAPTIASAASAPRAAATR